MQTPEYTPSYCLNNRSATVICRRCQDVCPTKALSLPQPGACHLDSGSCCRCGHCIRACPTLALDFPRTPYRQVAVKMSRHKISSVVCRHFTETPDCVQVECLGVLDPPLLLSMQACGQPLQLATGKCGDCRCEDKASMLEHLENLLTELDLEYQPWVPQAQEPSHQQSPAGGPAVSRRSLFGWLGNRQQSEAPPQLAEAPPASPLANEDAFRLKRALFNRFVEGSNPGAVKLFPSENFAMVVSQGACRQCHLCVRICPAGALEWQKGESGAQLTFDARWCLACHKCQLCPAKNLSLQPLNSQEYCLDHRRILAVFPESRECIECGDLHSNDAERCRVCEKIEENRRRLLEPWL
ncbi:4Fe-4S dicluster domain-containing protein [Desulfurispira natronophila]|uniref:Fe-S-cluster-containing hydrogenase component 2 n=1 Tax=Desulfurispira natronophila TaxID=682562 RepID=A0A7W8DH37_9BACT|nr:4Fe-4S dicluster domain-containing protein [Desulfurispira natronophila]MBB5022004.1 Fe-S-cluster-containing hydrogenase component 2 [Desulfurispira natronophila]